MLRRDGRLESDEGYERDLTKKRAAGFRAGDNRNSVPPEIGCLTYFVCLFIFFDSEEFRVGLSPLSRFLFAAMEPIRVTEIREKTETKGRELADSLIAALLSKLVRGFFS